MADIMVYSRGLVAAASGEINMMMFFYSVNSEGRIGIAPFCVHTYAEVRTASECASWTLFPLRIDAMNAAVKLSPAPTVSATSTRGVGWNETFPGVKT